MTFERKRLKWVDQAIAHHEAERAEREAELKRREESPRSRLVWFKLRTYEDVARSQARARAR